MYDLAELTEKLKKSNLCALPQSAAQMIELAKNPKNGPKELAVPISADMGLATQVLRFVNSSFFGFRYKITSLQMALSLASVRTIKNFVLWNGLFAVLPNPKCGPFSLKQLFQDALCRAVFARQIVQRFAPSIDGDEAFMCALMQDMAIPLLANLWHKEYEEMIQIVEKDPTVRLSRIEHDKMGWDHSEAGIILVNHWGFSPQVADAVSSHASLFPHEKDEKTAGITTATVTALSALLPPVTDVQWHESQMFLDACQKMFPGQIAALGEIMVQTDAEAKLLTGLVNLGIPPKSLGEHFEETFKNSRFYHPV
ncbi:MAG: HDOD domain-containing protein [Planctomycetaceae bacterium]|nr:HDOD domain-containing protein [Planctomycetaceae bacterium]